MKAICVVIFFFTNLAAFAQDCVDNRRKFDIHKLSDDSSLFMVGDVCTMEILFQFNGGSQFYPEFTDSLDVINRFLVAHPNLKIQISSHCDSRGSREMNLKMTESRAKRIEEYLLHIKTLANQFMVVGKGEDELICSEEMISAASSADKREIYHRTNRRVEIKIISIH